MRGEDKDPSFSLGTHVAELDRVLPDGALVSAYADGTDGRNSTVILRCGLGVPHLTAIEPHTMQYVIEAWLPAACTPRHGYVELGVACLAAILMLIGCRACMRWDWRTSKTSDDLSERHTHGD